MVKEWRAIQRVGEWLGLKDDQLEDFVSAAHRIHERVLEQQSDSYDLEAQYFEFLNQEVFANPQLVQFIDRFEVDNRRYKAFEEGTVPVEDAFRSQSVVDYGLDELVDFVMLLKLIRAYQRQTGEDAIQPLEKLYTLVYLVNHRISQKSNPHSSSDDTGFGMLERTGYRYSFTKDANYPTAESLVRDKDRLIAWELLDETVFSDVAPAWDLPYRVGLGEAGEFFIARFTTKIDEFESIPLREWDLCQSEVIDEYAEVSQTGLQDRLEMLEPFSTRSEGHILLNGRPKRFVSGSEAVELGANLHV